MIKFKNKLYRTLFILYSIVSIGSTVFLLIRPTENRPDARYEQTKDELENIKKYLEQKDSNYLQTIDSLQRESDSLQTVIFQTDNKLLQSRSQVKVLSGQVHQYVYEFEQDTSLQKNDIAFDSLSDLSRQFITQSFIRDSLCDSEINTLKELVVNKEAEFNSCDSLLTDYRVKSDELLLESQNLNKQLLLAEKKNKRTRRFNRVLTVTAFFFGGIVIAKQIIQ